MGKDKAHKKDKDHGKDHGKGEPRDAAHDACAPGAADAQVCLQLYDLRREAVMRQSREVLLRWFPESFDEVAALADFGHEHNAAFRQVTSYFEMAYGLARRGAVHPELLMDWCGEGIFLYAKLHPFLEEFRERLSPTAFSNTQWMVENTEGGRVKFELHSKRLAARKG